MKLYEIDRQIEEALSNIQIDEDTGTITGGFDAVEALTMEREQKIEGVLLAVKNEMAEASAIRAEEIQLAKRRQMLEKKIDSTREWLKGYLAGEKFKTAKVSVSYRNGTSVKVSEDFVEYAQKNCPDLLRYKEPDADKAAIGKLLKSGTPVYGCCLVDSVSLVVK